MAISVNINASTVGASIMNAADPSAVNWIRVNADNTVTYRTAAQTLSDLAPTTTQVSEGTNLYYTDARVRATALTGLSISGGSINAADTVLSAFGKLQNQIAGLLGGAVVQGVWNATTNTPALASGVGTTGHYYVVNVAGSTNLDGITDWKIGDWAIFINGAWNKVDNTDAVSSVNGYVGAVSLVKADIGLGNVEDTALSTWAGSTNITTLGTIGSGTWNATTITIGKGGTGLTALGTALQQLRVNAGATALEYFTPASAGITIGDAISGSTANRILYAGATNLLAQKANFTMDAVATGVLDVPVSYAIAGTVILRHPFGVNSIGIGVNTGSGASSDWMTALGKNAGTSASGYQAMCIGPGSTTNSFANSIAFGPGAICTAANQLMIAQVDHSAQGNTSLGITEVCIGNNNTNSAPASVTIRLTSGLGSNIQGGNLTFNAGRSTGDKTGGYHSWGTSDAGASGSTLRAITEKMRLVGGGDLVLGITSDTKGLVLKSPDGNYWRITIDNAGVLAQNSLGTSIPT